MLLHDEPLDVGYRLYKDSVASIQEIWMPLSAEDVTAIEQLIARHYHHYDLRDPVPFADTFTEDGVLQLGKRRHEGREALEDWARTLLEQHGTERYRHWVNNLWIDGDGDEATLRCYLVLFDNTGDGRVTLIGQYDDRLRRVDGEWKFSYRHFEAEYPVR